MKHILPFLILLLPATLAAKETERGAAASKAERLGSHISPEQITEIWNGDTNAWDVWYELREDDSETTIRDAVETWLRVQRQKAQ
jgi:hypothetical protein